MVVHRLIDQEPRCQQLNWGNMREREEARRNRGHVGPPSQWPIRRQLWLAQIQREGLI